MSTAEKRLLIEWETPDTLWGWIATLDHKRIGERYLVTAMIFMMVGGLEALMVRLQLMQSNMALLGPESYNQIFSLHGITMIFWYAYPILAGFGNYLIPLMLGSRDMAFPRLNAFSYWTFLLSGIVFYGCLLLNAPDAGWFAYVPLTSAQFSPGHGLDFYALALIFNTISVTAGAINFIVTIFCLRASGMTLTRMPLFMYSTLTASFSILISLPALTVACVFLELDRQWHTRFFDVALGGSAVLWQQLFWFFGHPWVYIVFLPATGMISMILPVMCRRPIVAYGWVAAATVMTGIIGFGVWLHHMFAVGMGQMSMTFFSAASMTISLFSAIQVFAWLATIWKGRIVLTTSMLYALGFLALLVVGGLNGIVTAIIPIDWQVHDTYFIVSHLHYVLIGANVFPVFAAFYYWLPKMTGRLMNERLGRWSFWIMFVGFNIAFFPMHFSGMFGMPRRIYTFAGGLGWDTTNLITTLGAFLFGCGIALSLWNYIWTLRKGTPAGNNPWKADTLEWSTPSPPMAYAFVHLPLVRTRHPLWDDFDESSDPGDERILDEGRSTLKTTLRDASPVAISKMPEDTAAPFVLALALTSMFIAFLFRSVETGALSAVACLAAMAYWLWPASEESVSSTVPRDVPAPTPLVAGLDRDRGVGAMWLVIATEGVLFLVLFFAYFYLASGNVKWPMDEPPSLAPALFMLALLLASSVVLHLGEKLYRRHPLAGKVALLGTILLGVAFLAMYVSETREHLRTLTPTADAYASSFYTITGLHALHLSLGLAMLAYVLFIPVEGIANRSPYRPYRTVSMYWHFVDVIWILIVGILYVAPQLR